MAPLYIPRHCRKVVGFLTRDEIVAILLGGGPEHLDRTARLRASAHDAPGFARCHNDGTA